MTRTLKLAVIDDDGVYRGEVETVSDPLDWVRSENRFPVPDGFDLPPHRYQLRKDKTTGKEAFWPIAHARDAAAENRAPSVQVNPAFIAKALLKFQNGEKLGPDDERQLHAFLNSFDGKA